MTKNSPRATAGELQEIVESWGQKTFLKKLSNSTYITTCCLGWFQEKISSSYKNNLKHIQLSDTTGTSNGTIFVFIFYSKDGFGKHGDKKYPMCTMKCTAVFLMLWAYISAGGSGRLV